MKVLIVNGPNLNNLGRRDTSHYGVTTLPQIEDALQKLAQELGLEVDVLPVEP